MITNRVGFNHDRHPRHPPIRQYHQNAHDRGEPIMVLKLPAGEVRQTNQHIENLPIRLRKKITFNPETECWIWFAGKDGKGYGQINIGYGAKLMAHRRTYEYHRGTIPEGLELDHLCRTLACCNPWHLEAVTHQENVLRGTGPPANQARRTHCPKGHPYNAEHMRIYKNKRICYTCQLSYRTRRLERAKTV